MSKFTQYFVMNHYHVEGFQRSCADENRMDDKLNGSKGVKLNNFIQRIKATARVWKPC